MVPKVVAGRFHRLSSEHAIAGAFPRDMREWVDTDICWWCRKAIQDREHVFKVCAAWREEPPVVGEGRGIVREQMRRYGREEHRKKQERLWIRCTESKGKTQQHSGEAHQQTRYTQRSCWS